MDESEQELLVKMGRLNKERCIDKDQEANMEGNELINQVQQQLSDGSHASSLDLGDAQVAQQLAQAVREQQPLAANVQRAIVDMGVEALAPEKSLFARLQKSFGDWRLRLALPTLIAAGLALFIGLRTPTGSTSLLPMTLELRGQQKTWQGSNDGEEEIARYAPNSRLQILLRSDDDSTIQEGAELVAWAITPTQDIRWAFPDGGLLLTRGPTGFLLEGEVASVLGSKAGPAEIWIAISLDSEVFSSINIDSPQTLGTSLNNLDALAEVQVMKTQFEVIVE